MALHIFQDANALLRFCAETPQGLTTDELAAAGWTDQTQLLSMANQLLANGRLTITQVGPGKLLFKAGDHRLVGLDPAHMAVYQLIEKTSDKGANNRLLKDSSRLHQDYKGADATAHYQRGQKHSEQESEGVHAV